MTNQEIILKWFKTRKKFLSIKAIGEYMQKGYGMHPDTLQKALNGSQDLPDKWIMPLFEFISNMESQRPMF